MEAENNKTEAAEFEAGILEGTKGMGYWEFRREFCTNEGWQLRRTDPQTYEVHNSNREKIGILKSGKGYFPSI